MHGPQKVISTMQNVQECKGGAAESLFQQLLITKKYVLNIFSSTICRQSKVVYSRVYNFVYTNVIYVVFSIVVSTLWTKRVSRGSRFSAPMSWNNLQIEHKFQNIVPLYSFKTMVKSTESTLSVCQCFIWVFFCPVVTLRCCHCWQGLPCKR